MEIHTLLTSDIHYFDQCPNVVSDSLVRVGIVDRAINIGDLTVLAYDEMRLDPGYQAKLDALALGKSTEVAKKAQKNAWNTNKEEMIKYAIRASIATKRSMGGFNKFYEQNLIPKIIDIVGNSDIIVHDDVMKANEILGTLIPSNLDHIQSCDAIEQLEDHVYTEMQGSVKYIGIPFAPDKKKTFENEIDEIVGTYNKRIKKIIILSHEHPIPELLSVKRSPKMDNLPSIVDYVSDVYKKQNVSTSVVSGHVHKFPLKGDYIKFCGVNYYSIGCDMEGNFRYAIVDREGNLNVYQTKSVHDSGTLKMCEFLDNIEVFKIIERYKQ